QARGGSRKHLWTDVDRLDASGGAHLRSCQNRYRSSPGPEIEDCLSGLQVCQLQNLVNYGGETGVYLSPIDIGHLIPHSKLPSNPSSAIVGHDFSSLCVATPPRNVMNLALAYTITSPATGGALPVNGSTPQYGAGGCCAAGLQSRLCRLR